MKKLHKRTILVASAVMTTAATIGISASVVYATEDTITKTQIAQNIEHSLEDRMFGTIKLMPASKSGTFHEGRLVEAQKKLKSINDELNVARGQFTVEVKARMPLYGIINDVLNVSSRFDKWRTFIKRVQDAIKAINKEDWVGLEEAIFDKENNGEHMLISPSYGVKRSDLEQYQGTKNDPISNKVHTALASFQEYVDLLKNDKVKPLSGKDKAVYINSIVCVLRMMAGTQSGTGTKYINVPAFDAPQNEDSIVYMLQSLKILSETDQTAKNLLIQWNTELLPSWQKRYQAIDQFFDDSHEPISNSKDGSSALDSAVDLEAYKSYDLEYRKTYSSTPMSTVVDKFLDGEPLPGQKGPSAAGFLTNWEFLRLFFGDNFEKSFGKTTSPAPTYAGTRGTDRLFEECTALIPNGTKTTKFSDYWKNVIGNIFTTSTLPTKDKATDPADDRALSLKLSHTKDLEDRYEDLKIITDLYDETVNKIKSDSFAIGIKLKDLQDIVKSYELADGWNIKINSYVDKGIGQKTLDDLIGKLNFDRDGVTILNNSPDYFIDKDGYIFPTDSNWQIFSTDTLSLEGINFKDGSKLQPFEHEEHTVTVFKPYIRINEDADKVSIDILWDHITGDTIGGHNDK